MTLKVYTAATTEPLTVDEVKQFARIDGTNAEPAPSAPTVALASPAAAGNVDNGAHRYRITFVTADGETEAGTPSSAVTVADKTVNGKVQLTAIPVGGAAVTSRKLYRTAAGGSTYLLLASLADNTTATYLDNIADASLGAGAPSANTTEDPLLNLLIKSATAAAQQELGRYLITQTIDAIFDSFPCGNYADPVRADYAIRLPPLQSVVSITYLDADGVQQTLDPSLYDVDASAEPRFSRIEPSYGNAWPSTYPVQNAVTIRTVMGYGAAGAVPGIVKNWMLVRIKTLWDNRDGLVLGPSGLAQMPTDFVDSLLDPERVHGRF